MWRHDLKLFACRGGYNRAPWHGRELKERHRMRIWVDADACPGVIKEILFRAAERAAVSLTLVANKPLRVPRSPHIRTVQVAGGFDVADRWIAGEVATCLLNTSPSPRDGLLSRMPSSARKKKKKTTTEIYTLHFVGSVKCVYETAAYPHGAGRRRFRRGGPLDRRRGRHGRPRDTGRHTARRRGDREGRAGAHSSRRALHGEHDP